ncbi:hypothetical protein [Bdellovibrio sp. KM01]|uniref:hypothetical protein n=1 Tax=Bdellovibrio sp. KM01 TaxID=2748865 RepID=UPI0015E93E8C|nr:hypothetical protein [Bdellovibrio sp. KM01]QLY26429.1 hypothetical protein HW988_05225 [Bdellovibrio sp. KM01]
MVNFFLVFITMAFAIPQGPPKKTIKYAVIFEVLIEQDKVMKKCEISKVIDPTKGTDAIKFDVPQKYKESACKIISTKGPKMVDGKATPFYTYYFLDPNKPEEVITK